MTTATTQAPAGAPVRWEALLGASGRIPRDVAICPECSRTLHYQVTAADEDGTVEVDLDCWAPVRTRWGDWTHRYWQSDWQETVDKCRAWVKAHAPNNGLAEQKKEKDEYETTPIPF